MKSKEAAREAAKLAKDAAKEAEKAAALKKTTPSKKSKSMFSSFFGKSKKKKKKKEAVSAVATPADGTGVGAAASSTGEIVVVDKNVVTRERMDKALKDSHDHNKLAAQFHTHVQKLKAARLKRCRRRQKERVTDAAPVLAEKKPEVMIIESLSTVKKGDDDVMIVETPTNNEVVATRKVRFSLIQFHSNYRPAFWGTLGPKRSKLIQPESMLRRLCRKPASAKVVSFDFDYEVDSDDEWEEDEPGETLSDADEDDAELGDNLDYEDG